MGFGKLLEYKGFKGIANTTDRSRIPQGYLEYGFNIDIDDEYMVHRRKGYEKVYSGDKIHSLWSNRDGTICLFCEGSELKRLNPDFTATTLLSGITPERMNFVEYNGKIFFSNKHIIGMIEEDGVPKPFPNPTDPFKKRMVGGHLIEICNSRLYAAQNNKIFFSDATVLTQMDMRKNFMQFDGYITMLKGLPGGMYVGAGDSVYFLSGDDPLVPGFVYNKILNSRVIEGSAITIDGEKIKEALVPAIMWACEDGIYIGLSDGTVRDVTNGMYSIENAERGSAIYSFKNGYGQYLFTYILREGHGGGQLSLQFDKIQTKLQGG